MPSLSASPIKARTIRVVSLNDCGAPVTGTGQMEGGPLEVVTTGFVRVQVQPQYNDGVEMLRLTADGIPCVNEKDPSFLKRANLTIDWCVLDPETQQIISGEDILRDIGGVTGTGMMYGTDPLDARFSLELWQPVAGANQCDSSGQQRYVYWAFMNVTNTKVGDFAFENAPLEFSSTHETDGASSLWGDGPGTAGPWIDESVPAGKHFLWNITTEPPPASTNGAVALS